MHKNVLDVLSQEQLEQLEQSGYRVVPKKPHKGILVSMAIRDNHGFLMPDSGLPWKEARTPEQMDSVLRSMAQLYEEATGSGFAHPENMDGYVEDYEKVKNKLTNT